MNNKSFIMMNVTELDFIKKKLRRLPGANSKGYPELTLNLQEMFINSYKIHFCIFLFLKIKSVIMCDNDYHR